MILVYSKIIPIDAQSPIGDIFSKVFFISYEAWAMKEDIRYIGDEVFYVSNQLIVFDIFN